MNSDGVYSSKKESLESSRGMGRSKKGGENGDKIKANTGNTHIIGGIKGRIWV